MCWVHGLFHWNVCGVKYNALLNQIVCFGNPMFSSLKWYLTLGMCTQFIS